MNKTRLLSLSIGVVLVFAAITLWQAFKPALGVKGSELSYTGRGDYQRFEAGLVNTSRQVAEQRSPYTGIGDLRAWEAQPALPNTGAPANNHSYTGMGDLHRFEAGGSR